MAEVIRPAAQRTVQLVEHLGPGIGVGGHQQVADLGLEALHALLGRTGHFRDDLAGCGQGRGDALKIGAIDGGRAKSFRQPPRLWGIERCRYSHLKDRIALAAAAYGPNHQSSRLQQFLRLL